VLDGVELMIIASHYYGLGGGLTSYVDHWVAAMLGRSALKVHLTRPSWARCPPPSPRPGGLNFLQVQGRRGWLQGLDEALRARLDHSRIRLAIIHDPRPAVVDLVCSHARARHIASLLLLHSERADLQLPDTIRSYGQLDARAAVSRYLAARVQPDATVLGPILDLDFWSQLSVERDARSEIRRQYALEGRRVLLAPHRISSAKGQLPALEALAALRRDQSDWTLVMAGHCRDRAYARRLGSFIDEHSLHDAVRWLPEQTPSELRRWYVASDIVLSPTFHEALGLVALEAQAMGRPVVAFRVGGVPETLRDGETGLLVEPGDAIALSHAIARIGNSTGLSEEMGERASAFVRSEFDSERTIARHEAALRQLLIRAPGAGSRQTFAGDTTRTDDLADALLPVPAVTSSGVILQIEEQSRIIDLRLSRPARFRGLLGSEHDGWHCPSGRARLAAAFDALSFRIAVGDAPPLDPALLIWIHERAIGGYGFRGASRSVAEGGPAIHRGPRRVLAVVEEALSRSNAAGAPAPLRAMRLLVDLSEAAPFDEGNGRTARLAASYLLMRSGYRSTLLTAVEQYAVPAAPAWPPGRDRAERATAILALLRAMMERSRLVAWLYRRARAIRGGCESLGIAGAGQEAALVSFERQSDATGRALAEALGDRVRPWCELRSRLSEGTARALGEQLARLRSEEEEERAARIEVQQERDRA
jgi:glycosyltransferase involved in cell wall biosynthesis